MSWFSNFFHTTIVPTVEKTAEDPNVQSALVNMIKGIISTALANPSDTTAILQNSASNAEKLVGAALASTPAQGLVNPATLPSGTPATPVATIPASPGATT